MSRVLLFCQTGSERPKCIRSYREEPLFNVALDHDGPWWLVSCDNAYNGRRAILCHRFTCVVEPPCDRSRCVMGQILASGGKT